MQASVLRQDQNCLTVTDIAIVEAHAGASKLQAQFVSRRKEISMSLHQEGLVEEPSRK